MDKRDSAGYWVELDLNRKNNLWEALAQIWKESVMDDHYHSAHWMNYDPTHKNSLVETIIQLLEMIPEVLGDLWDFTKDAIRGIKEDLVKYAI